MSWLIMLGMWVWAGWRKLGKVSRSLGCWRGLMKRDA